MSLLPISQLLPGRLMHAALRGELVEYLMSAPLRSHERRRLYRRWCEFTYCSVLDADLERLGPTLPEVVQLTLPE